MTQHACLGTLSYVLCLPSQVLAHIIHEPWSARFMNHPGQPEQVQRVTLKAVSLQITGPGGFLSLNLPEKWGIRLPWLAAIVTTCRPNHKVQNMRSAGGSDTEKKPFRHKTAIVKIKLYKFS